MRAYLRAKRVVALDAAKRAYNAFKMRPQKEEILDYLNDKKDELAQQFNVTTLGLFGSYALGQQTEDSDIDLLIEFAPQTEDLLGKKTKIKEMIRSEFYKEVDLCREKYIKPYFRKQILASVIYVWKRSSQLVSDSRFS